MDPSIKKFFVGDESFLEVDEALLSFQSYQKLNTGEERNSFPRSRGILQSSEDEELGRYWELYTMIQKKEWQRVEYFVRNNPDSLTAEIDTDMTIVDLIIRYGDYKATWLIDKLASRIVSVSPAVQQNFDGGAIVKLCAASGNLRALEVLVSRKPNLPNIPCKDGFLPVHYAALYGQNDTLQYLLRVTGEEIYSGKVGTELLVHLICGNLYDIALDLLKNHPEIGREHIIYRKRVLQVMAEKPLEFASGFGRRFGRFQRLIYKCIPVNKKHVSSIQTNHNPCEKRIFGAMCHKLHMIRWKSLLHLVPCIKVIHDQKVRHMQAVEIVRVICKGVIWTNPQTKELLTNPFFEAARLGISEFVKEIIAAYDGSVYWMNKERHTIFHVAVLHRRAEIFNLIYGSSFKLNWLGVADGEGNNILHIAGRLVPSSEVAGAALQMQRELQWFKMVENLVHPFHRETENVNHETPRQVFAKEHIKLVKEGEKWMKETASSCSVVAALIITVVFAAAFTVPGGNDSGGKPNFLHEAVFIIFAISDALALFSSIISVLMFLGILTSRYSEEDFLLSLPRKLIIGLITLFFSIASMMVAFGATFHIALSHTWKWTSIPVALVGCVPVILFACLQFPLLFEMSYYTCRGIFRR